MFLLDIIGKLDISKVKVNVVVNVSLQRKIETNTVLFAFNIELYIQISLGPRSAIGRTPDS